VLPRGCYHEDAASVIRELLEKGSISRNAYSDLVSPKTKDELLEANVFALSVHSKMVTFQSNLVRRYCEQNPARWKEEKVEGKMVGKVEEKVGGEKKGKV
jgi:hypothetical protein